MRSKSVPQNTFQLALFAMFALCWLKVVLAGGLCIIVTILVGKLIGSLLK